MKGIQRWELAFMECLITNHNQCAVNNILERRLHSRCWMVRTAPMRIVPTVLLRRTRQIFKFLMVRTSLTNFSDWLAQGYPALNAPLIACSAYPNDEHSTSKVAFDIFKAIVWRVHREIFRHPHTSGPYLEQICGKPASLAWYAG